MERFRDYATRLGQAASWLGPWAGGYALVVSLATVFLLFLNVSGNGSDQAWLLMVAIGLPGSVPALILGTIVEILALGIAGLFSPPGIGAAGEGSGLSAVGYGLWAFIAAIQVAYIIGQAALAKLALTAIKAGLRRRRARPSGSRTEWRRWCLRREGAWGH